MPNHITNIVKYEGDADRIKEMLEQIKVDEFGIGTIDFNKLIPMPESLNIESGSRTDRGLKAYKEFLEIYTFGRKVENLDLLNVPAESEEKFLEIRKDVERGDWELGKKAFQNAYQYGYSTWYEWSINNWGTKWNSYGYSEDMSYAEMDALYFTTAWSSPHPVMNKLAEMYPDIKFTHEWADEDIGQNCGRWEYENGEITSQYYPENDRESIEFAAKVMDYDLDEIGLVINAAENDYISLHYGDYELVEVLGKPALFSDIKLTDNDIPKGLYSYHIRTDDAGDYSTLEENVTVNYGGTIIINEKLDFGSQKFITFDDNTKPHFIGGDSVTFGEYLDGDYTMPEDVDEDESEDIGELDL